uniref:Uncharacterized protein n=1 Tax=Amphimedon queenslandica TaxID=400682 RepID=A0A1X7SII8_AMPQE
TSEALIIGLSVGFSVSLIVAAVVILIIFVVCFRFKKNTKKFRQNLEAIKADIHDVKQNVGELSITNQSIGPAIQYIADNRSYIASQVPMRAVNILEEKYSDGTDDTML